MTRLELLDERGARRPQLAIDVGDAIRKALAHLAGHAFDGLRQTRADLIDLLDEALMTRSEILDQRRARRLQPVVHFAAPFARRSLTSCVASSSDWVIRAPISSICSTRPS